MTDQLLPAFDRWRLMGTEWKKNCPVIRNLCVRQIFGDDVGSLVAEVCMEGPTVDHHNAFEFVRRRLWNIATSKLIILEYLY